MVALVLGIVVGVLWPDFAAQMKPFGDGFIKLIKMIIAPLVFGVVVHGIASAGDLKKVGRVGVKSIVYFEVVTTIALVLGIVVAYLFGPGHGMNVNTSSLDAGALATYTERAHQIHGAVDFVLNIIPSTFVGAFANGDILQVLVLAVLFGAALSLVGERAQPVTHLIELVTEVLFKIIGFIIRLAPLGVFGAIAYTVGAYGVGSLQQLGVLVVLYYLTVVFFVVVILGGILRLAGFSIFKLLRYLREELMIVLGTASSDAVLPQVMRKLEHMGIKDSTVGLVIPTGYSFNLDAFSIYLTLATVFIAQATNTPRAFTDLLLILGVALLTSQRAHGIPGSAIVVLAATLSAVPVIPAIGLVLVLSVDWFMGMARALGNMTGNCVATVVIAAWEGDIDRARAHRVLNGEAETLTPEALFNPEPEVSQA
jgi:aerobic C4-dicarboxylate transport protein